MKSHTPQYTGFAIQSWFSQSFLVDPCQFPNATVETALQSVEEEVEEKEEEEEEDPDDTSLLPRDFWNNTKIENRDVLDLLPAGGMGNELISEVSGRKPPSSPEGRQEAETRQDRLRAVEVTSHCDRDNAQTEFEATRDGRGEHAGVIPRRQRA